jgi:hypothetical protein
MEFDKIYESACAGDGGSSSVTACAPEHTIEVVNGDDTKTLKERLELRKELNAHLFEAIDTKTLAKELSTEDSPLNSVRYKLQKFTNGGTPYVDENGTPQVDGKKGDPSGYEAWRAGINDKKRTDRLEQEEDDRTSIYASPKNTDTNFKTLDGQRDDFLSWYVDKYGQL